MIKSETTVKSNMVVEGRSKAELEDGALLAAALAAALVEYRRHVGEWGGQDSTWDVGTNWRTVACWERLQGRA